MSGPEARLEAACCRHAKALGCWGLKLWPLVTGLPDRLFLLPGGRVWFVEFKAPGGVVSKRQRVVHAGLLALGFTVSVIKDRQAFTEGLALRLYRM